MLKLLWPFLILNLSIPGLIWRGTIYFISNNSILGLIWRGTICFISNNIPGLIWRGTIYFISNNTAITLTCELPRRTPATHFWRQMRARRHKMFHFFFTIWYGFWYCKSRFVKICCLLQREKLPDFNAFPVTFTLTSLQLSFSRLLNPY